MRSDLANVLLHRLGLLREVQRETDQEPTGGADHLFADPGQGQEGHELVVALHRVDAVEAVRHGQQIPMGQHRQLRLARGAGSRREQSHVVGFGRCDPTLEVGFGAAPAGPSDLLHCGKAEQEVVRVGTESAWVVVDDFGYRVVATPVAAAQLVPDFQQLVDLLLVLGDHEPGAGELHQVTDFDRDRILVHAEGPGADRLRRELRDQPLRTIVAQHRHDLALLQAELDETAREVPHPFGVLGPGQALPDAELLLPQGDLVAALPGVLEQQLRQRVRVPRQGARRAHWEPPR